MTCHRQVSVHFFLEDVIYFIQPYVINFVSGLNELWDVQ